MKKRRLVLLVLLGVLFTVGGLGYRHYFLARPVGRGPAGPAVDRQRFQETWTPRDVLLVGLGDSVTAGFGASPGRSYFQRLVENPDDEFLGHGIHCTQFWREHYRPHDPHYWYADNLEDPNDRGYDAIRRLFLLAIAEVSDGFRRAPDLSHEPQPDRQAQI